MNEILNNLETIIMQKKAEEAQFKKELDWCNKLKEIGNSDIITLTRKLTAGVSKFDHYNNLINEVYVKASSIGAEYFIVAANCLPIFCFATGFEMTTNIPIQGSYVAGTYKGFPIIVSPCLDSFEMICGAGADMPDYNVESIDISKFILIKLYD